MSTTQPGSAADLVLRGVVRPDAFADPTDAVAVRDGRVVALGEDACRALVGAGTEVLAVDGVVTPGFVDAHVHYPQTDVMAAWGTQLLDWLTNHTFPA